MSFRTMIAILGLTFLAACGSSGSGQATTDGTGDASGNGTGQQAALGNEDPNNPDGVYGLRVQALDTVYFDTDRYDLSNESQATLQRQAAWLNAHPAFKITVEGHADERGTREYNLALGDRRANTVANFLVALGVDKNRLSTVSFGKERPAVDGHDETAWAKNRRSVTVLSQ